MLAHAGPALRRPRACVAVLGVTPEVVGLAWPADARLLALDHSAAMIARVWRPHPSIASHVLQSRWQSMPLPPACIDLVVGDGSLNNIVDLDGYGQVVSEIARVLAPGGRAVVRCFVRPDRAESLADITSAVWSGRVGSFHALKWRIAMLVAQPRTASVAVAAIRNQFNASFPDRGLLAHATGWPRSEVDTIDAYEGASTRYTFPTLAQLTNAVQPWLEVRDVRTAGYELGDRCPTVLFQPPDSTGGGQT